MPETIQALIPDEALHAPVVRASTPPLSAVHIPQPPSLTRPQQKITADGKLEPLEEAPWRKNKAAVGVNDRQPWRDRIYGPDERKRVWYAHPQGARPAKWWVGLAWGWFSGALRCQRCAQSHAPRCIFLIAKIVDGEEQCAKKCVGCLAAGGTCVYNEAAMAGHENRY